MAHFYFDTANGGRDTDRLGLELKSEADAIREAIRYAGALIKDEPSLLDESAELLVIARTTNDEVVARVRIELTRQP